ncbi:hypothetical protein ACHAWU_009775 [Discostella pseudostelligera]|uniref:Carbohydrate kinase PfkB domain-containing protein n=1 Tax=Discostella pseudostelligera TaxID=259834 RepID=A0ABD3M7B8_9STRA
MFDILLVATLLVAVVTGFLPPNQFTLRHRVVIPNSKVRSPVADDQCAQIIVIGKIILDKYGDPDTHDHGDISIGGGGPQSAWGACAALGARDMLGWNDDDEEQRMLTDDTASPPKQNVTFVAPIGLKNWTPEMTISLNSLLPMLKTPPKLVTSLEHMTPTIHIWHDTNETVNWTPMDESFGEQGADGLWRLNLLDDILDEIENHYENNIVLHAILQCGHEPTGNGLDALPLFNSSLMERVSAASIEPILFPDEAGVISHDDRSETRAFFERVVDYTSDLCESNQTNKLVLVSPDRPCYDALCSSTESSSNVMQHIEFAVRDGSNGSIIDHGSTIIPPATLKTIDGKPVNPTGAGNAYAGAYAACRGTGSSMEEAACIANAVGAVVCEYENLPPWTWEVLERVVEAACEVRSKIDIKCSGR